MESILCLCVDNWDGEERLQRWLAFSASQRPALRHVLLACMCFDRGDPGYAWEMCGIGHDLRDRLSSRNVGPLRWGSCVSIVMRSVSLLFTFVACFEKHRLRIQGNTVTLVRHGRAV